MTAPITRSLSFSARGIAVATAGLLVGTAVGCVKVTETDKKPRFIETSDGGETRGLPRQSKAGDPAAPKDVVEIPPTPTPTLSIEGLDPSEEKLGRLSELLLTYYGFKKTLPPKLEDLASVARPGQPVDVISPIDGKPFVYVKPSLNAAMPGQRIVAYSSAAGPDNLHRAVMMSIATSTSGGTTPTAGVARLTDKQLQEHLKRVVSGAEPAAGFAPTIKVQ